ncbi:DUF4231 domain-containing protein [Aquimarina gracilis]|uniref:DUF4231 domain-containing protein n=1 Tax=Aquimarina gracilis TaxID=874422 RepID=A0ABU5ZX98_9FLAO|nr:DUF4231 domain-containing protein [Aquimarina gracilis]MEB3346489.1 DUF4231 domain-containing protein [Aquimarina gracilis]
MNEEQYIKDRVEDQIKWYGTKSAANKRMHLWTKGLIISFSAFIPLISGFLKSGPEYLNYVVGALGMVVAILTGISELMKFQEKWAKYRTTAETLKHEKFLYMTKSGHYHAEKAQFNQFVSRIETYISTENSEWSKIISQEE